MFININKCNIFCIKSQKKSSNTRKVIVIGAASVAGGMAKHFIDKKFAKPVSGIHKTKLYNDEEPNKQFVRHIFIMTFNGQKDINNTLTKEDIKKLIEQVPNNLDTPKEILEIFLKEKYSQKKISHIIDQIDGQVQQDKNLNIKSVVFPESHKYNDDILGMWEYKYNVYRKIYNARSPANQSNYIEVQHRFFQYIKDNFKKEDQI